MAESFDQEQAIADYTRLMEAGPVAENEKELQALIERANAQGMYFDYDRESRAYVLVESQVVRYNREMDERNRIIRESVDKPWLPLHDGE